MDVNGIWHHIHFYQMSGLLDCWRSSPGPASTTWRPWCNGNWLLIFRVHGPKMIWRASPIFFASGGLSKKYPMFDGGIPVHPCPWGFSEKWFSHEFAMQRRISPFLGCERPVQHLGMHPQIVTLCAFDDTFGIEEKPSKLHQTAWGEDHHTACDTVIQSIFGNVTCRFPPPRSPGAGIAEAITPCFVGPACFGDGPFWSRWNTKHGEPTELHGSTRW